MLLHSLLISICFSQIQMPTAAGGLDAMQIAAMTGEVEMPEAEDLMEMGLLTPGGISTQVGTGGNMFGSFMNNPYNLPAAKCLDNDLCKQWVTMQSLVPQDGGSENATDIETVAIGTGAGIGAGIGTQTLPGMLPAGFHPELYGLDPDAQMKDCADEASCMAGLRAFSAMNGQPMPMFIPTVMLASPRPQYYPRQQYYNPRQQYYNPQYTLRAPRPHYNLRSAYGVPHYYGYQPVYYQPSFYYY